MGFLTIKIIIFYELPKYEGTINIQGIVDTVSVFTDDYGVPHVFAENENDLFIVAGYIAARERLFQMSLVSYAARGELASVLGDDYLSTDIYLRTWRIHAVSKKMTEEMSKYSNNINQYINKDSFVRKLKRRRQRNSMKIPNNYKGSVYSWIMYGEETYKRNKKQGKNQRKYLNRCQKHMKKQEKHKKYMVKKNFHMASKYRRYVDRMRSDSKLVLDMNGKNINHLVSSNGRVMSKEMLDRAAWIQETLHLRGQELLDAQRERKNIISARGRRRKTLADGKRINASIKYPPSKLRYRIPKQEIEGLK